MKQLVRTKDRRYHIRSYLRDKRPRSGKIVKWRKTGLRQMIGQDKYGRIISTRFIRK